MKLFSLALSAVLASCALAQRISIGSPADMATVAAGSELVVEVDSKNSLSSINEIALVIGISFCPEFPCLPPSEVIGTVLLKTDNYAPQFHSDPSGTRAYENFTVTIPSSATGTAQLNIGHFSLLGVSGTPSIEYVNTTIVVV